MKTKDLIARLNEIDPTGEGEVCVGNEDVYTVVAKPCYWDGCQQILERDDTIPYYNVIGARYRSSGTKICIEPLSVEDAIGSDPELPVTYESEYTRNKYQERVDKWRQEVRDINAQYAKGK